MLLNILLKSSILLVFKFLLNFLNKDIFCHQIGRKCSIIFSSINFTLRSPWQHVACSVCYEIFEYIYLKNKFKYFFYLLDLK